MAPAPGAGYLIANDRLTDAAFALIQPSVNVSVPSGGIAAGPQSVLVFDPSMYVGAQIIVGVPGSANIEVVTITDIVLVFTIPVGFEATFANAHVAGEPIVGATFPLMAAGDALFTQAEMLAYISTAVNDFLTDVPLVYAIGDITVNPTQQNVALPSNCLFPVRIANASYPLKETSQVDLDSWDYKWTRAPLSQPRTYFRDKVPLQNIGVWPRAGNTVNLEVVYAARGAQLMGLADGFPMPDAFTMYVLYRVLSFAYSKDGEMRNPGLAKYFNQRFHFGVKVSKMFLDVINDPNPEFFS